LSSVKTLTEIFSLSSVTSCYGGRTSALTVDGGNRSYLFGVGFVVSLLKYFQML